MLKGREATKTALLDFGDSVSIMFERDGVSYRISGPLADDMREARRLWRVVVMVTKARLVAVEEGVSTFEQEFIGQVVLPGGRTLAESYAADLPALASSGATPQLALPGGRQ